jgi:3-dehydroquinate synthetase
MNISLSIARKDRCRIIIQQGLMHQAGRILKKEFGSRKIFVITDGTVRNLHYRALSKSLDKA